MVVADKAALAPGLFPFGVGAGEGDIGEGKAFGKVMALRKPQAQGGGAEHFDTIPEHPVAGVSAGGGQFKDQAAIGARYLALLQSRGGLRPGQNGGGAFL